MYVYHVSSMEFYVSVSLWMLFAVERERSDDKEIGNHSA